MADFSHRVSLLFGIRGVGVDEGARRYISTDFSVSQVCT
jgi:hypothetical protein